MEMGFWFGDVEGEGCAVWEVGVGGDGGILRVGRGSFGKEVSAAAEEKGGGWLLRGVRESGRVK